MFHIKACVDAGQTEA